MINKIKSSIYLSFFLIANISAQIIDGEFLTNINNNTYTVTVAINLQSGNGTAGVVQVEFTYNSTALDYPSSPIKNVDYTLHGDFDLYTTQNVTKPNNNTIRISLLTLGTPSPVPIDTSKTSIISYYLTITNPQGTSNLVWTQTDIAPEFLQQNYQIGYWPNLDESLSNITSAENNESNPESYTLFQNFPNPFNSSTKIKYQLLENAFVILNVYDIQGNLVSELVNGMKTSGYYEVDFNSIQLSSGMYFYKLIANDFVSCRKMLLLK